MSLNKEIKQVIIEKCKNGISDLADVTSDDLSDSAILDEAWSIVKKAIQEDQDNIKFNQIIQYIASNIVDFTEKSEDEFVYINKIAKSNLDAVSLPFFYNEESGTCLLYISQNDDENNDIDFFILSKIILRNFESILALKKEEIAIFQKKDINELCLKDKKTYCKVLLANIGLSIKDDIAVTQKTFIKAKQLTCNKNYLQYKDSINILNRYNNTADILWKFLLLYQILENFVYRKSIAKSLKSNLFLNVKHLSSVYTSSKGEGNIIKKSIKDFLLNIYLSDDNYYTDTDENGNNISLKLKAHGNKIQLDNIDIIVKDITDFLNIELGNINSREVSNQEIGEIIYIIRNCIVHNKETEWIHINTSLLQTKPNLKIFFEKFVLPTMEFIVKELIFKEDTIIDYPANKPNYILIWGSQPNSQGD